MKIENISSNVMDALRKRHLSDEEIQAMTPEELFTEYCEWNGMMGWSRFFIDALDNLRAAAKAES